MAIALSLIAVFLGYSTSKYYPKGVPASFNLVTTPMVKKRLKITSATLYLVALVVFILQYGAGTGFLVWLFTISLLLSLLLIALPYNPKWIYVFIAIAFLSILINSISYAS